MDCPVLIGRFGLKGGRYLLHVALDELRRGDLLGRQTLLQLQPHRLAPLWPAYTQDTHTVRHTHASRHQTLPPPSPAKQQQQQKQHKQDKDPHERETQQREQTRSRSGDANFSVAPPPPPPRQLTAANTLRTPLRRFYLYGAVFFLLCPAGEIPAVPCRGRRATASATAAPQHPATPWSPPTWQDRSCRPG